MSRLITSTLGILTFLLLAPPALAQAPDPAVTQYVTDTLQIITIIATAAAALFLIKGGYGYITSTGNPNALEASKKTIRSSGLGLTLVLSAHVIVSVFRNALTSSPDSASGTAIDFAPIEAIEPTEGLTQVLIDAVSAFMQNIVQSATSPIVDGIIGYLTTTPNLLNNSVIFNFWLVSLGIVDALFVLVVALLGLQVMSAASLGYEEVELKQILPKIGLAMLGANLSLFLADYVIITNNMLVKAVLDSTGGLNHAWVVNAVTPSALFDGTAPLITLIFLILFLIVAVVLLLMYISRLIFISLSAVLAPFIFLLWALPKFSDFAEIATKTYFVTVFMVFVHVVVIQLASAFLALPDHNENSLVAIAVAIGLYFTLLKVPSLMMQMVYYASRNGTFRKVGNQIINVISTDNSSTTTRARARRRVATRARRRVINA